MNPQQSIPTLDDDGKIVWDSHAITRYLVAAHGKDDSLCPKDPFIRSKLDQRLHYEDSVLFQRFGAVVRPVFHGKSTEFDKDAIESLYASLDTLEIFLNDDLYFVGNNLTVADFSILATVTTLMNYVELDGKRYPKIFAWLNRMKELPYYEEANGKPLDKMVKAFAERINPSKPK